MGFDSVVDLLAEMLLSIYFTSLAISTFENLSRVKGIHEDNIVNPSYFSSLASAVFGSARSAPSIRGIFEFTLNFKVDSFSSRERCQINQQLLELFTRPEGDRSHDSAALGLKRENQFT